jgi:hypothetical protein
VDAVKPVDANFRLVLDYVREVQSAAQSGDHDQTEAGKRKA